MREERWMCCTDCLKLANEQKSTWSAGKLFQRFTTRSAKKLYLMELLQKCLKILCGWPLVELERNSNVERSFLAQNTAFSKPHPRV